MSKVGEGPAPSVRSRTAPGGNPAAGPSSTRPEDKSANGSSRMPVDHRVETKVAAGGPAPPEWALPAVRRHWPLVLKIAEEVGVPPMLLASQMQQESQGRSHLVSPAGAKGLMQLMPDTARSLGVRDPFNPEQSLRGGARYLKQQLDTFEGDVKLALAAYNAGPGNVRKYGGVPPFRETRNYVREILERVESA